MATDETPMPTYRWEGHYHIPEEFRRYEGQRGLMAKEMGEAEAHRALHSLFGGSAAAVGRWLGYRSPNSISIIWARTGLKPLGRQQPRGISSSSVAPPLGLAPPTPADPEESVARDAAESELLYYRKRAEYLERECSRLQDAYHILGEGFARVVREQGISGPAKPYIQPSRKNLADEELTLIFISDVHVGERVKPAETAGMTSYSAEIFEERCERYKEALSTLVDGHLRRIYPLRKAFVPILGDICTGEDVFALQPARIDRLLLEQVALGAYRLSELLRFIAGLFEEVWVYAVPGNHGQTKTTTLNTDTVTYLFMAQALANQPNLHFIISDSEFCGIYVDRSLGLLNWPEDAADARWNLLFTHGHQARGWAGVPYYGLDRLRQRFTTTSGIVWDKIYAGHHHTSAETAGWRLVGSWVGGTGFSVGTMQAASPPTQLIQGLHPKRGLTWSFDVYLGDKPGMSVESAAAPGIYTPHNEVLSTLRGDI